jgi:hypothetical protein
VKSDLDLQFVYSIFEDHKKHRSVFDTHYSKLTRPVVRRDSVTTALTIAWFGRLQPFLGWLRNLTLSQKPKRSKNY